MADYKKQYLDPRWQKKRLEILQRDDFTCQLCGDKEKTLHVHHRYYLPHDYVWDYDEHLLVTLCADCHAEEPPATKWDIDIMLADFGFFESDAHDLVCSVQDFLIACGDFTRFEMQALSYAIRRVNPDFIKKAYQDYLDSRNAPKPRSKKKPRGNG